MIETLVIYGVSVTLYVTALSTLLNYCLKQPGPALILFVIMLAAWWMARFARLEDWKVGQLEFEELPEPAVRTLSIERD